MQPVTWEGSATILQNEEGFCLLLPVAIYSLSWLNCSSVQKVVTAARVHAIFFGRGGVPPASIKFSRQYVSQEVLDQLGDCLLRDDVSRPSSCRSVLIEGKECPVRYWQYSIKQLVRQYQLEFPNGVKRSYIYAHIQRISEATPCVRASAILVRTIGSLILPSWGNLYRAQQLTALVKTFQVLSKWFLHCSVTWKQSSLIRYFPFPLLQQIQQSTGSGHDL